MELYIIRHGQSTNNALGNPQDRVADPPLTELGHRQAEIVARHLASRADVPSSAEITSGAAGQTQRGYGITRLYCSPMWRALQTAQPIGQALGLNPEVWIDIHERGGMYLHFADEDRIVGRPGASRQEILVEFPNYVLPAGITERGWWTQGFEDPSLWRERAARVAHQLCQWSGRDERIALVSHGGFVHDLLQALFNLSSDHHFFHHNNTAISRIDFDDDGFLHIRYLNRVDHLSPELVS